MEAIKTLREIIGKLTPEEKGSIRTYLKVFVLEWKGETNRGLQLFEYLVSLEERKQTIEEIEMAIYKKPNRPALKRLANRTRLKVLEALIIDINIDRGIYDEKIEANIEARKKLTQAQILHGRGLKKIARNMVENVAEQCRKYELYDERLIALRFLIRTRALVEGREQISDLFRQYQECDFAKNALIRAEINHIAISSQNDFHSEQTINNDELRQMLDEMRDDFKQTDSAQIGYYYFQLEAQNWQQERDYKKARTELLNSYTLIKKYPSVKTNDNLIGALLNIADNDFYLAQFERAYDKADEAMQLCKKGSINYEVSVEVMFLSKFFKGEYEIAYNLLTQLIPSEEDSLNFRAGKRSYFLAATYFMLQDFQTALKYLNLINPIETDKQGWNLGIKILQIMTAIELNEFDDATGKIEALRKYFANNSEIQNHRAKLILQIFQQLKYNGYGFKAVFQDQNAVFDMLNEKGGALEWQIKSFEMIIFNQWFIAKASRQNFIQIIPSAQIGEEAKNETVDK